MAAKQEVNEKKTGLGRYFKGVKSEMKKVVWPTKDELVKYSILVIFISILAALITGLFDAIIYKLFGLFFA